MSLVLPIDHVDARFRRYTATTGQTQLAVDFPFQSNEDIAIYREGAGGVLTPLAEVTDYTLTGADLPGGGTATLVAPASAGDKFVVIGDANLVRTQSIAQNGKFNSRQADNDFTRLVIIAQEIYRELDRTLRAAYGTTAPKLTIGAEDALLAFDGDGNIVPGPVWDEDLGIPGKSAYELAVANGFVGNEAAWLASLVGPQGAAGANGTNGTNGTGAGDMLAANNLSDLANKSTARTNLGVAIGSNVQAYSARLADVVTIGTPAADRLMMWDQSATAWAAMTVTPGLVIVGTELRALETWCIPISDETTALTTGTAKASLVIPYAFKVLGVAANLNTVSSSGTPTFDVNEAGTSILGTKIVIDANEFTGGSAGYQGTAAGAATIADADIAAFAKVTVDIDVAGTGAKGAKVYLIGYRNS